MARNALIIKGADFSANKLDTVEIIVDEIPCTAIDLSETAKTITALGDFMLTATVTPADTTDAVIWTTSDASVATVSDGVVSVIGLGIATITATCGEQAASCSVDASEIAMDVDFGFFKKMGLQNNPDLYAYATSKRELLIHSLTESTGTKYLKNQTADPTLRYPIMLPPNTASVKLSYNGQMRAGTIYFGWMDSWTAPYDNYPNNAGVVMLDTSHSTAANQPKTWEYSVASGADSFAIILTSVSSDYSDTDTPDAIAEAREITVKCCAATE